jgi:hypothetical protein
VKGTVKPDVFSKIRRYADKLEVDPIVCFYRGSRVGPAAKAKAEEYNIVRR